jgi:hypothetical protein
MQEALTCGADAPFDQENLPGRGQCHRKHLEIRAVALEHRCDGWKIAPLEEMSVIRLQREKARRVKGHNDSENARRPIIYGSNNAKVLLWIWS